MSLLSNPTHTVTLYRPSSGQDAGGGVELSYTLTQSSVPCLVNIAGASEQELYGQEAIVLTGTAAFRADVLSSGALVRGGKLVTSDGTSFHVTAIRTGLAMGSIPRLTYADITTQAEGA